MPGYSIYLELEGIQGASTHGMHPSWIRIRSIEWGVTRDLKTEPGNAGNRERGEVRVSNIRLTKDIDSATPALFREGCIGRRGLAAKVVFETTGSGGEIRMEYQLENVLIGSYRLEQKVAEGGSDQDSSSQELIESLELNFTRCEMKYIPTSQDNVSASQIVSYYDVATTQGG